jgi:acyl-coenzyme A synthetase/AMP-(fatty) acid ligase
MTATATLYHYLETRRKKVAFSKGKDLWTYERLATEVERLTRGLVERGLRKGDRVALHMANLPEFVIAYHACFRIGAIAAPLNIRFKTAELRPLLQRLRPALYIGQAAFYDQVAPIESSVLRSNDRFVVDGPVNDPRVQPWTSLLAETDSNPVRVTPDVDAPAVLLTTSGTTGQPKFVIHTLATLSRMAEAVAHWDLDGDQITALFCPMVHVSGLLTLLACFHFGVPFVSRKKHLIIRGGSNIAPVEIERVLMSHPAVREAAVVGVLDPELGERVAGFVQLADDAHGVEVKEILAFATERLADYKVPETLQIVDEIPRNALGKIDRRLLLTMNSECESRGTGLFLRA